MQVHDARLSSFSPILRLKSRTKTAFPLTPTTHRHLTPINLAEAGFYHSSTQSNAATPDTCRCFLCDVQLGGWDPEDDPFEEHLKRGGCAWADVVCWLKVDGRRNPVEGGRKRTVYPTEEALPSSSQSTALRLQTFEKDGKSWWPHKKKGWLPTVTALAKAGFIYTPTKSDKDNATCPLCQYSVEGWEATDDPWDVHQKKFPECPFFTATVDPGHGRAEVEVTSKTSRSSAKSEGSKKSKRATTAPMHDPEPPLESEPEESAAEGDFEPSPAKPVKPRATAGSSRSKSRSRKTVVEPELEEEAPTENVESQAVVQTADVEDEGEEKSKPSRKMKGRPTKSRSKKKVDPELADEEQELVEDRRDTINASTSVPSQRSQPSAPQPRQQSQPGSRPLSQLDRFANLPPSSPVAVTPQKSKASKTTELPREALDISVQDGAMQARRVIEDLAKENEAGLRDPLSDDQRGMTLEELVRSEMRRQYEAMEREGKALIGKWEERTRESRLCIEGV